MDKHMLRDWLEGPEKELQLDIMPLDYYSDLLQESGFEMDSVGDDTNGWAVDFRYNYHSDTKGDILLSGSLWYGEYKLTKT